MYRTYVQVHLDLDLAVVGGGCGSTSLMERLEKIQLFKAETKAAI